MCSRVKCHQAVFIIVVAFSLSRVISIRFDGRMVHRYRCILGFARVCCVHSPAGNLAWSSSPLVSLSFSLSRFLSFPFPSALFKRDAYTYFYASFLPCRHRFRAPFRTLSPCRVDYYVPRNGSNVANSRRAVTDCSMRRRFELI